MIVLVSSGYVWQCPSEFPQRRGAGAVSWRVAVDGELAEEWLTCLRWDPCGSRRSPEPGILLLSVNLLFISIIMMRQYDIWYIVYVILCVYQS